MNEKKIDTELEVVQGYISFFFKIKIVNSKNM